MNEDDDVTVTLPLAQWRAVVAHVEGGVYRDVHPILDRVYAQVNAQIFAANERAAAEIAAAEALRPSIHPEGTDDSADHTQALSHSPALH